MPEDRVFDVSKPGKTSPSATSKPVIVGHRPMMNDPMVKEDGGDEPTSFKIHVNDDSHEHEEDKNNDDGLLSDASTSAPAIFSSDDSSHTTAGTEIAPSVPGAEFFMPDSNDPQPQQDHVPPAPEPPKPLEEPETPLIESPHQSHDHSYHGSNHHHGLHVSQPPKKSHWLRWTIVTLLALIVAGYLLIDAGVINAGIKLPYHVFKQKTETQPASQPATSTPIVSEPALPAGFTKYTLSGTQISFATPTTWGDITSTTESGYSNRSASSQPDGTYAYLVSFASNKDVQIAVTSSKYLPPARAASYYDFLQWCVGTNDSKYYQTSLKFSTANKVDTPTTATCDQGPLLNVTKINDSTIVQTGVQDASKSTLGDVYTKNLKNTAIPVLRVKDATSTHSSDIKKLLETVKESAS